MDAKAHFKGINSYQDIAKFKWEDPDGIEEKHIIEISDEDIKRLKETAKQWEK